MIINLFDGHVSHYQNAADAQRAIILGRGMPIDGRPCRTEVAKVNRMYLPPLILALLLRLMNIQRVLIPLKSYWGGNFRR